MFAERKHYFYTFLHALHTWGETSQSYFGSVAVGASLRYSMHFLWKRRPCFFRPFPGAISRHFCMPLHTCNTSLMHINGCVELQHCSFYAFVYAFARIGEIFYAKNACTEPWGCILCTFLCASNPWAAAFLNSLQLRSPRFFGCFRPCRLLYILFALAAMGLHLPHILA